MTKKQLETMGRTTPADAIAGACKNLTGYIGEQATLALEENADAPWETEAGKRAARIYAEFGQGPFWADVMTRKESGGRQPKKRFRKKR